MTGKIENVWQAQFIADACERNPSRYISQQSREEDRWENAKDKMRAALEAITAWANTKGLYGGPDASHLATLVKEVCNDTDMHVEALREYEDVRTDAKVLGKVLREINEAKDFGPHREIIADNRRFNKDFGNAWNNYVEE